MPDSLIELAFTPNIDFTNSPDPHAAYGNFPRVLVDHDLGDALREHPELLDQINKVVDDVNKKHGHF